MVCNIGEYKGKPVMELKFKEEDNHWLGISFSTRKAHLIVQHIDEIKQFVKDNPLEAKTDKTKAFAFTK